MFTEDELVFCKVLSRAFDALSYPGRVLLMKHMIDHGPVTVGDAMEIVGDKATDARKMALRDLRELRSSGLARQETVVVNGGTERAFIRQTWRVADSCVAKAVRRALCPNATVYVVTGGVDYGYGVEGVYATRGGADAACAAQDKGHQLEPQGFVVGP